MSQVTSLSSISPAKLQPQQVRGTKPVQEEQRSKEPHPDWKKVQQGKAADKTGPEKDRHQFFKDMDEEELEVIQETLNQALEKINIGLQFTKNEDSDKLVVKVLNKDTEEVIRQIPPEAMIEMAQKLEELSGVLIDLWG